MNPTQGQCIAVGLWVELVDEDRPDICSCWPGDFAQGHMHRSKEESSANALLIADAFNTYNGTGHAPSVLAAQLSEHKAARIAYASEFPPNTDGEPDVGNIHANIRALKAQRDALLEVLIRLRSIEFGSSEEDICKIRIMADDVIANATKGKT